MWSPGPFSAWEPPVVKSLGAAGRWQRVPTLRPGPEAAVTPGVPSLALALPAPPRPGHPSSPGPAPERGSTAAAGSGRRRHLRNRRPRPEQEAKDKARSRRQRRGPPGDLLPLPHAPLAPSPSSGTHLLDVFPHLQAIIADHQQLQSVVHKSILSPLGGRLGMGKTWERGGEACASLHSGAQPPTPAGPA